MKDESGNKFGKWTVIEPVDQYCGQWRYKCRCECGRIEIRYISSLRQGTSTQRATCMGLASRSKPHYSHFLSARRAARRQGYKWSLSFSEFCELAKIKSCFYCEGEIFWPEHGEGNSRKNLDRLDNKKGYAKDNVVVSCASCNQTRGDRFTFEEFKLFMPILNKLQRPAFPPKTVEYTTRTRKLRRRARRKP